jgi:ketosteroid isomerase-like protein
MDRARVAQWIADYERAWRAAGTDALAGIFTPGARYLQEPYREQLVGLGAIARMWERERTGPDEAFVMTSEIVAVDGDTAVARVYVEYLETPVLEYRDLWVMRFGPDGRCAAFEEWPFAPSQPGSGPVEPGRI